MNTLAINGDKRIGVNSLHFVPKSADAQKRCRYGSDTAVLWCPPPMENPSRPDQKLTSWKEIAAYLGVTVRTAQKWESERGLPVRRLPGKRGVVWAAIAELDAWRNSAAAIEEEATQPITRSRVRYYLAAGGFLVAVALVGFWLSAPSGNPITFRLDQAQLTILDVNGSRLWQKTFDHPLQHNYQPLEIDRRQYIRIVDLDGDGRNEVLFSYKRPMGVGNDVLICYSPDGREKWRFVPGKNVRTAERSYPPPYNVHSITVAAITKGGPPHIVVSSHHFPDFPNQIALLSSGGTLIGEYWHPGHLPWMQVADFDNDGLAELYLAGVNNARRAATVVALDPRDFSGAAVEDTPAFQLLEMRPARERGRAIFQRTCFNQQREPYNVAYGLWLTPTGLTVQVDETPRKPEASLLYHLDSQLNVLKLSLSDSFRAYHAELRLTGSLDHEFTEQERRGLERLLYVVPAGEKQLSE